MYIYIYIYQGYALCRRPPECILGLLAAGLWGCWLKGFGIAIWLYLAAIGCLGQPFGGIRAVFGCCLAA